MATLSVVVGDAIVVGGMILEAAAGPSSSH
jgi:hypothetical protein